MNQRDVVVGTVRSPVLEVGTGREAAVFVHGNPGSGEDWRELVAGVGSFMRAVAPTMPGFGKADKPADFDYTVDGYARHLDGLIEALDIDRVHLVVHDFGGPWGLNWASRHPAKIASVSLINIGVLRGYRWHFMARIWRTPLLGEISQLTTTRTAFRALLGLGNPRGLPRAFVDRMYDDFDAGTKRAILKLYRATSDIDGFSKRLHDALRPLDLPALVVWGLADIYLPGRYARAHRRTRRQRAFSVRRQSRGRGRGAAALPARTLRQGRRRLLSPACPGRPRPGRRWK